MNVNLAFRNPEQEQFYWSRARNNCFSGGFNNGKSEVACQKQFTFLSAFFGYRSLFYRQKYKDLKATTMQTFFKVCPEELIHRHDEHDGITILKNKGVIYWMHMDTFDEQSLRGLEINSATGDQIEEINEALFLIVDSRIGRWDGAVVPEHLLLSAVDRSIIAGYENQYGQKFEILYDDPKVKAEILSKTSWPKDPFGRYRVHNFHDILCNPETQFHWVYQKFHWDSHDRKKKYFYIERSTDVNLGDPETMEEMQSRDPEWVAKYFKGQWGVSSSQIHILSPLSIINTKDIYEDPDPTKKIKLEALISLIKERGAVYRVLDHGDTSPTCCLWFSAIHNYHIAFLEYYQPNAYISAHRQNIFDITETFKEGMHQICEDYADPQVLKKTNQKDGGFWSNGDEYADTEGVFEGIPAFQWAPADNNELATRNRINELLQPSKNVKHPITDESPAPRLYFIKRSHYYPHGCHFAITHIQMQRRELIGTENGKSVYSDDRDKNVTDHAYDPLRYYIAMHGRANADNKKEPPKMSFARYNAVMNRRNAAKYQRIF